MGTANLDPVATRRGQQLLPAANTDPVFARLSR